MSERTYRLNEPSDEAEVLRLLRACDRLDVPRVTRAEFVRKLLAEQGRMPFYAPERGERWPTT